MSPGERNTMHMALCVFECCADFMCRRGCTGEPERGARGREWARHGFHADPESIAGTCVEFGQFEGVEQDWGVGVSVVRDGHGGVQSATGFISRCLGVGGAEAQWRMQRHRKLFGEGSHYF